MQPPMDRPGGIYNPAHRKQDRHIPASSQSTSRRKSCQENNKRAWPIFNPFLYLSFLLVQMRRMVQMGRIVSVFIKPKGALYVLDGLGQVAEAGFGIAVEHGGAGLVEKRVF